MPATAVQTSTLPLSQIAADWLIVGVTTDAEFSPRLQELDGALEGVLTRLKERGDIKGKLGERTYLPAPTGLAADRLLLIGIGPSSEITLARFEQALMIACRKAAGPTETSIAISIPETAQKHLGLHRAAELAVFCAIVGSTTAALYKGERDKQPFTSITLATTAEDPIENETLQRGAVLAESVNLTRELVNRHPEDIYPDSFATVAANAAASHGIKGEILDHHRLAQERMNSLLAVARGSKHEARLVVLEYQGAGPDAPWLGLCGKGVTFDSGGLSLKPSPSMLSMKGDMAGASTVLGAMIAIARLKLPVNVFGMMGLVENMIGPHAFKLGEVLTARNGTTIEVHNTDAEGRLVLADVLCYAAERQPKALVDLATLTGACLVALGEEIAGAFTNQQAWCDEVLSAAKRAGEEVWQLPMHDSFADQLKGDFADIRNIGGKWGGAITAAKFLEKFVNEIPWVHLDIAGPSFAESGKASRDIGATGSSVRTLVELAEHFSEWRGV
ncbi:leucyl aminopeptidase [Planctomicrobium sp. SH664]|uniref:leucyl aminopeptidase n=1 Tax=Planctomicrobium sp. SH664 TaxID=3448125 RepID=UPI003F5B8695